MTKRERWASDHRLVQLTLAGDADAISSFADRMVCIPKFMGAFSGRSRGGLPKDDLLDACQETRLRLWRDRHRFNGECLLETWIYRYSQLVFRETLRERAATHLEGFEFGMEDSGLAELESGVDDTPMAVDHKLRLRRLRRALCELDPDSRAVIHFKVFEGYSFSQLAELMELNVNTTKSRYYQALENLEAELAQQRGQQGRDRPVAETP